MKQSSLGLSNTVKRTRKREFLDAMEVVVPWAELVALIEPYAPDSGRRGQQPFAVQTLLRIHFMQQWFNLSDPAMEEALHDVPAFRDFAGLSHWDEHIPSESSILRFRHLLERHKLAEQILATVHQKDDRRQPTTGFAHPGASRLHKKHHPPSLPANPNRAIGRRV